MFYANNELVKGIFLNGRNYNYLAYGFGKIIPEDRNSVQLNLNLALKYLNQYRIEYGTVKDGYDNALVSPRVDKPDSNGIFHTPFTYYYNGNIVPTKEVNILITNGKHALRNALVYNDMNINGAINYFAENTDFQGHNVNVFKEADSYQAYQALLNYEMLNNCSNFNLNIETRFSKEAYPTLYNCNNFSGNFRYVGNSDVKYPGFRGFLYECRDGSFNIDCTNMHGGGSDANVTNYYNFSGIQSCNNIKLNITGSSWQAWVHPNCYSSNCNINTRYIVPGFGCMNDCNFNIYLPSNAEVEKSAHYSILSNSYNCNVYFDGIGSNFSSFRKYGDWGLSLFEDLNNCNLNLALSNSTGLDYALGNRLNNCNIHFENMNLKEACACWYYSNNCNITGNVNKAEDSSIDLVAYSININLNVDASSTNNFSLLWYSGNINGNVILGNTAYVSHSSNVILNLYNGNYFDAFNVSDSKFALNDVKDVGIKGAYNCNFNLYNAVGSSKLSHLDNVTFIGRFDRTTVTSIDNCFSSHIYVNTINGLIENVFNTYVSLDEVTEYNTVNVYNCDMTGFPCSASYHTEDCTFRTTLEIAQTRFRDYFTWANVWPHTTPRGSDGWDAWYSTNAGLKSTANLTRCYLNANNASQVNSSTISFDNNNNMIMSLLTYYDGVVTANLPEYDMEIKLNVDCNTLNLGIRENNAIPGFHEVPAHGFQNATISANNIYAEISGIGIDACVQVNRDTKIYCENYCDVPLYYGALAESDNLQPVVLINNYRYDVSFVNELYGGLSRFGSLSYFGTSPADLTLRAGAFVFINNALLGSTKVMQNSVLFLGSNVRFNNTLKVNVSGGGLIVGKLNWSSHASEIQSRMGRGHLAWNIWDSGPWGSQSLFDYCINV